MRRKLIAGAVIIGLAAILLFTSLDNSLTPYVSFDEAKTRGERVQVIGSIVRSTVIHDSLGLSFTALSEAGEDMEIVYGGPMPANFDQADKVVCVGMYKDGRFRADELLLKCPSKYQGDS